jgi:hypothetical protein
MEERRRLDRDVAHRLVERRVWARVTLDARRWTLPS